MLYGFERSTDQRCPNTQVKKFTSMKALRKWLEHSGHFTHSNPKEARNYHHTFRYGYQYNGRVDKKDPIFKETGTSTYPIYDNDRLYYYMCEYGERL